MSRSRERSRESNDKSRDGEPERHKSKSRGSSKSVGDVGTKESETEEKMEPEVKRKRVDDNEEKAEEKSDEGEKCKSDENNDQKGGWKTLQVGSVGDEKKDVIENEGSGKPFLAQGFGFGTNNKKLSSLKSVTNLAAKPSLFEEESKPEKKLDMFSVDSEDDADKSKGNAIAKTDVDALGSEQISTIVKSDGVQKSNDNQQKDIEKVDVYEKVIIFH